MDRRIWTIIVELVNSLPIPPALDRRCTYPTRLILKLALWACLNDRPDNWACRPASWDSVPRRLRPSALPHPGTLSRRLAHAIVAKLLRHLIEQAGRRLEQRLGPLPTLFPKSAAIDGKPLTVRNGSGDSDATRGKTSGGFKTGYRLHAVVDALGRVVAFRTQPLNQAETPQVDRLLAEAAEWLPRRTVVLGDKGYDNLRCYAQAQKRGLEFWCPYRTGMLSRRLRGRAGEAARLRAADLPRVERRRRRRDRVAVERAFSRMGATSYGLKGLPQWVRGLRRVRRLVAGKILIYHCHLLLTAA